MSGYWQHRSRWVSSTAHKEHPAPPLSGWFFSVGLSTPSNLTACAPQWNCAGHVQTGMWERQREVSNHHLLIIYALIIFILALLDSRAVDRLRRLNVIKIMTQVFIILQLSTPYPTEPSPWERFVIRFWEDTGFAVHKMRIMKIVPVSREKKVLSLLRCGIQRCGCSLRADTGRWSESAHGCSWGSRQSCSGCSPAPGSPKNAAPHSSPW